MKNVRNIIGIDISKSSFDVHSHLGTLHGKFSNDAKGFKDFLQWIKAEGSLEGICIVMEHTGLYSYRLEGFLDQHQLTYTKRSPLDIRRSSGILRGKSDKADAKTIARYGWQKRDELQPTQREETILMKLRNLMAHRELLVTQSAAHKASLTELTHQLGKDMNAFIKTSSQKLILFIEQQVKDTEAQIKQLIHTTETLKQNYDLVCSVKGIGFVTATYMLLYTQNFTAFDAARKFNAYCGIAPFEYGSGTSIKGKTKVSHLANKKMKSLFHQAAIIATLHDKELKAYFERKCSEGKNKMSVYNAIRVKLVARIFAVIKRQKPFEENYSYAA